MNKKTSYEIGVSAEEMAEEYMFNEGYVTIAKRFKTKFGEIDLILQKGELIVFAEVKAKSGEADFELISRRQQKRIMDSAKIFISENEEYNDCDFSFDALIINYPNEVHHVPNAFQE